jgi:hypothetical protein
MTTTDTREIKIELSYNGEWLGYPVTLWPNEKPESRVYKHQIWSKGKIDWRYWNRDNND